MAQSVIEFLCLIGVYWDFFGELQVTITFRFGLPNKASSYSVHGLALGAKEVDATRQKPYEPFHVPNDVKG